jgi:hypothetical protein
MLASALDFLTQCGSGLGIRRFGFVRKLKTSSLVPPIIYIIMIIILNEAGLRLEVRAVLGI